MYILNMVLLTSLLTVARMSYCLLLVSQTWTWVLFMGFSPGYTWNPHVEPYLEGQDRRLSK